MGEIRDRFAGRPEEVSPKGVCTFFQPDFSGFDLLQPDGPLTVETTRDGRVRDPEPELVLGPVRPRRRMLKQSSAITRPPWLVRVQANRMYR